MSRRRVLLVAPLMTLALAGCAGPAPAPAPVASDPATMGTPTVASPAEASASPSTPSVEPSSAAQAGVDPANPPQALVPGVTVDTTSSNLKQKAHVKVEIVRLERRDKLVVAVFAVTPEASGEGSESIFSWLGGYSPDPKLIDPVGLKAYNVVQAGNADLMGNAINVSMSGGQTAYHYAVLAAPPAGVTKVDVMYASSVPTFTNVPLS